MPTRALGQLVGLSTGAWKGACVTAYSSSLNARDHFNCSPLLFSWSAPQNRCGQTEGGRTPQNHHHRSICEVYSPSPFRLAASVLWCHSHRAAINHPPADWRRRAGRPRWTWLRTIELDLQPHNLGPNAAWMHAQDRSKWRQLVEMAMLTDWRVTRQWWWWTIQVFTVLDINWNITDNNDDTIWRSAELQYQDHWSLTTSYSHLKNLAPMSVHL